MFYSSFQTGADSWGLKEAARCGPIDRSSHQSGLGMANWPRALWL